MPFLAARSWIGPGSLLVAIALALYVESASAAEAETPTDEEPQRAASEQRAGADADPKQREKASAKPQEKGDAKRGKNEVTAVPVVGGDSDRGFGGGYIVSFARMAPGFEPYFYRIESAGSITFKPNDAGDGVQMPYLDDYLLLSLPHVIKDKLELEFRAAYTHENTLKFYGLGNASRLDPAADPTDSEFEHARMRPALRWRATYHVLKELDLIWGFAYTHNWLRVPEDTLLGRTMQSGTPIERDLLGNADEHGVAQFSVGMGWDTRDSRVSATRGQYHTARLDAAPGGIRQLPYEWARLFNAVSFFYPLIPERLTFASRVVGDFLFGDPPFYELPRFDDSSALGGSKGVRGVPAQRYWGKAKVFTNIELRSELLPFNFWDKKNVLGVTAFFDAGRLWSDYRSLPELDGRGLGLKYGTGGGLRLTAGESFVLRADVAWSPDADPLGFYLSSGQTF